MSGTANQDELIAKFADVAGVDLERSRFYLEAAGWELDLALASFYEGDHEADEADFPVDELQSSAAAQMPPGLETLQGLLAQAQAQAQASREPTVAKKAKAESKPAPRTGLATLDSIRNQAEDDSSDEEDKRQPFYTGGSTTSGQQVLGPAKKKEEFIKDLFQKAREHGATAEEPPSSSSSNKPGSAFGGAGFKLGDTTSVSFQSIPASSSAPAEPQSQEVTLRLWSSGFTIDNGELRAYTDPANLEFLNSIKRGEIPRELIRNNAGREVELAMEDRRHEEYAPPKVSAKPFGGKGNMLGSPSPTVVESTVDVTQPDQKARNESNAREQIALVESEPTTNIQFRLADGSRLVARFNHTHTVNDLHNFINTARPQYSTSNYILSLFPNTDLTQKDTTVKDANLLNAALIQKIK